MIQEKIILAYSGGLDTSVILKWLANKGYDVVAYVADVGQQDDFDRIRDKALKTGASKAYVEDLKEEFVTHYIFPVIKANALYEGRYLLTPVNQEAPDGELRDCRKHAFDSDSGDR